MNNKLPHVAEKYVKTLESLILKKNIPQHSLAAANLSSQAAVVKERTDVIDKEKKEYMIHSEKKCRRIKSGRIPLSDEAAIWIRRRQVYHSIPRYHEGKINNKANLKRAGRRCGIRNALRLSVREVRERLKVCKKKCDYFAKHRHRYRRKFLEKRLQVAKSRQNKKVEMQILEIIEREKQ